MKSFLYKCTLFLSPLVVLHILSTVFYSENQGDLLRIGYIAKDNLYKNAFQSEKNKLILFDTLTSPEISHHYSVLTIGDSFSEKGNIGYVNYLADYDSISVLHITRTNYDSNPIETLYSIINGDLFEKIDVNYVVLQSVEREFAIRGQYVKKDSLITISDIKTSIDIKNRQKKQKTETFPPSKLWRFPIYNVLYHFSDKAYYSNVYRVKLDKPLFSGRRDNELLFFKGDLQNIDLNNTENALVNLNEELNNLSVILQQRKVKLIILPSPDKYDFYYDYIINKMTYPKPMFFEIMKQLEKNYIYVDSKAILKKIALTKKDIYYYDDSHWSPWASQLIAKEISTIIKEQK